MQAVAILVYARSGRWRGKRCGGDKVGMGRRIKIEREGKWGYAVEPAALILLCLKAVRI